MEFKIGDRVRVIDNNLAEEERILLNQEFVISLVENVPKSLGDSTVYIDISNNGLVINKLRNTPDFHAVGDVNTIYCLYAYQLEKIDVKTEIIDSEATSTNQHYMLDGIQPIEYIQKVLKNKDITPFEGGCIKDIIKYTSRYGSKDEKVKEAKKIVDYGMFLLCEAMGKKVDPVRYNHKLLLNEMEKVNE